MFYIFFLLKQTKEITFKKKKKINWISRESNTESTYYVIDIFKNIQIKRSKVKKLKN